VGGAGGLPGPVPGAMAVRVAATDVATTSPEGFGAGVGNWTHISAMRDSPIHMRNTRWEPMGTPPFHFKVTPSIPTHRENSVKARRFLPSPPVAAHLGVCGPCIRRRPRQALPYLWKAHARVRRFFHQPVEAPRAVGGRRCGLCVQDCVLGDENWAQCLNAYARRPDQTQDQNYSPTAVGGRLSAEIKAF